MTLYNCKHAGDEYRITKFTHDMEVESSYLCSLLECQCPAGVRPTCRHREMLPKFLKRNYVNTEFMFDHDRGGWVQMGMEWAKPEAEALDIPAPDPMDNRHELARVATVETTTIEPTPSGIVMKRRFL